MEALTQGPTEGHRVLFQVSCAELAKAVLVHRFLKIVTNAPPTYIRSSLVVHIRVLHVVRGWVIVLVLLQLLLLSENLASQARPYFARAGFMSIMTNLPRRRWVELFWLFTTKADDIQSSLAESHCSKSSSINFWSQARRFQKVLDTRNFQVTPTIVGRLVKDDLGALGTSEKYSPRHHAPSYLLGVPAGHF